MKINEVLNESKVKPTFDGNFPLAMEAVKSNATNVRYATKFEQDIVTIKAAIETGEIINTQIQLIKDHVNHFVKAAFDNTVDWDEVRETRTVFDDLYDAISCWDLRGMVASHKRLLKLNKEAKETNVYKSAMALIEELQPLVKAMEHLKSITVKASVKKAEAKAAKDTETAAYQKKYTDHKDVKKVVAILKGKAAEVEQGIHRSQVKMLTNVVTRFVASMNEAGVADYMEVFKHDPYSRMVMQSLAERVYEDGRAARMNDKKNFKLIKGWKNKIEDMAARTAAEIVDHFVYKNSGKLSFILFTKNNMKDVELKNVELNRGAVEAQLHCTFKDGSEFTADSSVVFAVSHLGTPFYRYPTTFRNVKLPDGSKMSQPSEQRMDEVFAITK